ncbi:MULTISPECIES: hypothetical protein [Streptomycetaceae]|uniref:hypothetical protein n=1 Tax=Streptomycetaceae TaxID=2062 RepID=UPI001E490284|nr:hypothetical protein [Streptantibioticus cattleyicolor]
MPVPGRSGGDPDLWAAATTHLPVTEAARADGPPRWFICAGAGSRITRAPRTLDVRVVAWSLTNGRGFTLNGTYFGHDNGHIGRLCFGEPTLTARAHAVLT